MNEKEKERYLEQYQKEKEKGVPFFPDLLFKDAIVSLVIFLILVGLAFFAGAPLEERADPADTSYTPRPEWYFLFLFQLLKYFPGSLEVIGVFVIPTIAMILLLALPYIDRSSKRHFRARPVVIGVTAFIFVAVIGLTVQAFLETPPPTEATFGDQTAALYSENCAPCHGPSITLSPGLNLHTLIAQGEHEGMPAWNADLTSDEIDALAGFIVSPGGSMLFTENCGACHEAPELVAGDPLELKRALDDGSQYPPHIDLEIREWRDIFSTEERTTLLNFLLAPDGQRLFAVNCAACHGRSVAFFGDESELAELIRRGGLHLEMPPWREKLTDRELDILANFVVTPGTSTEGQELFQQNCSVCHGERIPASQDFTQAREVIASGGAHETMPVWGEVLTSEQLNALVSYSLSAAKGTPLALGQELYSQNCAACHGDLGEGGPNPARPGDIIAPISTAEYLKTRDDSTLRAIISQGQPNFGMSPFGTAFGGPLDESDIESLIAFMRAWEENPPVELPPEVVASVVPLGSAEIYANLCAQCHGLEGEGGVGPTLQSAAFHAANTDQVIFETISQGHPATTMIAWGEVLTSDQIQQLVNFIRRFEEGEEDEAASAPSFAADLLPIFEAECVICHGVLGGWDGTNYENVMNSGDHAPTVIPGDPDASLLAQKLLGTHTEGDIMPPSGKLPQSQIQIILDWIAAGALDN